MRLNWLMAFVAAWMLGGCDSVQGMMNDGTASPLADAVKAFRAADSAALIDAQNRAMMAVTEVLDEAGDKPCEINMLKFGRIMGEATGTTALAEPRVRAMPEEARFVYAATHLGRPGMFDGPPPVDMSRFAACTPGDMRASAAMQPFEMQRSIYIGGRYTRDLAAWRDELMARHGAQFETRMRMAAKLLQSNGVQADWPAEIEVIETPRPEDAFHPERAFERTSDTVSNPGAAPPGY